jgi:hypothetical protein
MMNLIELFQSNLEAILPITSMMNEAMQKVYCLAIQKALTLTLSPRERGHIWRHIVMTYFEM